MADSELNIVVLISGSGTNLQAIIDEIEAGNLPARIQMVVSNIPDVGGLARAARHRIPHQLIDHKQFPSRADFDRALAAAIDHAGAELVVLAGFMRILTPEFTDRYHGKMLNIHPSLLPKYQGLHTHRRVLAAGDREHGATVHFVTADLDGGPAIIQAKVPVMVGDDETSLAARVLVEEHKIYPQAIKWFAEGRLKMVGHHCQLDGKKLPSSGHLINHHIL